jgi:FkbM family methyltransferase
MKRTIAMVLDAIPDFLRNLLIRRAAVLPPLLKSSVVERACARMSRVDSDEERLIDTNFGIQRNLRCLIPICKTSYAFGRPSNNVIDRSTLALVVELAKDCPHFLDVGANDGIYTLSVSAARQSRTLVHWFEPDKTLSERLAKNLERNSIPAYGSAVAAADRTGRATFFRNLTDDSSGSLTTHFANKHLIQPEAVETIRLVDYMSERGLSRVLVKVDVEGAGSQVWAGLREYFRNISYLVMEMIAPEISDELPRQIIEETSWHAYYIRDFDLVESNQGKFEYVEPFWNWLFCELAPGELARRLAATRFRVIATPETA